MKLKLSMFAALLVAPLSFAAADDYAGFRLGAGSTSGYEVSTHVVTTDGATPKADTFKTDLGDNLKVELGYDFNRIFALNASYTNITGNGNHYGISGGGQGYQFNNDFTSHKFMVEAEVGYAFAVEGFDIKPYAALGVAYQSMSDYVHGGLSGSNFLHTDGERLSKTGLTSAVGVRVNTPIGLYVDGRAGQSKLFDKMDENTTTITVGYKF